MASFTDNVQDDDGASAVVPLAAQGSLVVQDDDDTSEAASLLNDETTSTIALTSENDAGSSAGVHLAAQGSLVVQDDDDTSEAASLLNDETTSTIALTSENDAGSSAGVPLAAQGGLVVQDGDGAGDVVTGTSIIALTSAQDVVTLAAQGGLVVQDGDGAGDVVVTVLRNGDGSSDLVPCAQRTLAKSKSKMDQAAKQSLRDAREDVDVEKLFELNPRLKNVYTGVTPTRFFQTLLKPDANVDILDIVATHDANIVNNTNPFYGIVIPQKFIRNQNLIMAYEVVARKGASRKLTTKVVKLTSDIEKNSLIGKVSTRRLMRLERVQKELNDHRLASEAASLASEAASLKSKKDKEARKIAGKKEVDAILLSFGEGLVSLGGKVDCMAGKVDSMGGKVDSMGGKIDSMGGKLDSQHDLVVNLLNDHNSNDRRQSRDRHDSEKKDLEDLMARQKAQSKAASKAASKAHKKEKAMLIAREQLMLKAMMLTGDDSNDVSGDLNQG